MIGGPVDPGLDRDIRAALGRFPDQILVTKTGSAHNLVIKYVSPESANTYNQPGQKLFISQTPGFTWGRATYVTPLAFPVSTAIFGRVGVVATFDPHVHPGDREWHTFDTTIVDHERLYLRWLQTRPLYRRFALTAHSGYISQMLRDEFRLNYDIDCVLFRPDQSNPRYTRTRSDVWMAVSDWHDMPGGQKTIATGYSDRLWQARLTVVIEEEFKNQMGGIHKAGLLNLTAAPFDPDLADKCANAYYTGNGIVRVQS
jgi:hypothetical protein